MDDCPLCNTKCYVVNTRGSDWHLENGNVVIGQSANNAFVCIDCLIRWPTTGGAISRFTNSAMSKALPTIH